MSDSAWKKYADYRSLYLYEHGWDQIDMAINVLKIVLLAHWPKK